MLEKTFRLTSKDLVKLSFMIIIATIMFGLPGLIMMLTLQWITRQTYALDSADKHGISQIGASRLGGAAIFGFSAVLYIYGAYTGLISFDNTPSSPLIAWVTVFVCMSLGLIDDLKSNLLSPKVRLICIVVVFSLCLGLVPTLIPDNLGILGIDHLLAVPILGWLITILFCTGFVNAVNMADGANGLIPGTLSIAFLLFYMETNFPIYAILLTTCSLFTVFNIISGRLFLGDAGAYGLGSVLVLNGLYLFSEKVFSASFLAVLFAYPCIDIVVTVLRRGLKGRSIMLPDNDHLHNRIYFHCHRWFGSRTLANSVTGVLIVSFSSGIALFGYTIELWPVNSFYWAGIFLLQFILYCLAFLCAGLSRSSSQYVVSD